MKTPNLKGLSGKELEIVSWLELEGKRFFTRKDIQRFFSSRNELAVYIHRLRKKGRIVKINNNKYYLLPIQAYRGKWSEHPYILVDEMLNGKGYCIGGKSAAHYWGIIEQIPSEVDVFSRTRQGKRKLLGVAIAFRRVRKIPPWTERKIQGHGFRVAAKKESEQWK